MVSGGLARSRISGNGGSEVINQKLGKELNREMEVSGRPARSRISGPASLERLRNLIYQLERI